MVGRVCLTIYLIWVVTAVWAANPVVNPFTQPYTVAEDPLAEKQLVQISATADAGETIVSCRVKSANPGGPFSVKEVNTGEFWVVRDTTAALSYATTNFYSLQIDCRDSKNQNSAAVDLFVYVTPNTPPTITSYPTATATPVDVNTFNYATDTVYQVLATDAEGDTLTYSLLSQQPNSGLFSINSATGKITATRDLHTITTSSYLLTVQVADTRNTISDFHVAVTLDNLNTAPMIVNLPTTITIPEDAGAGTTLIKLDVVDATAYPGPVKPTCTFSPSTESYKFTLNTDNTITLSASNLLNYEVRNTYTITCSATDGYYSTDGKDVLTVNIQNVNEPPAFNSNNYYCTIAEGQMHDHYCTLSLTIVDPEGDALKSIGFRTSVSQSGNFYYDPTLKRVYFNVDYDLENSFPENPTDQILEAVDSGGATVTSTVHITVTDTNDNTCVFGSNLIYKQIDQSAVLGQIDAFTFTDADLTSPNKDAKIQIVSSTPTNSGDYMTVLPTGEVYYTAYIPYANSGSSYSMLVKCVDGGTPALSAFATVIISYTYVQTTTTTTTTTSTASTTTTAAPVKTIWDYPWFVAVFSIFMVLIAALLIIGLAYFIYKCCCQKPSPTEIEPRRKIYPDRYDNRGNHSSPFDDDDYLRSSRSDYPRSWNSNEVVTPRQIPALEYK
ncbi:protocadherin Fat 1-like [Physella acuta]|uniref:protocadherin Fat 1-like n=1 Tax=Physella acuta TaxID=109671 RepID=UPI0027DC61FB|nr:protocadherin Fat 1-like [Physella acuta]